MNSRFRALTLLLSLLAIIGAVGCSAPAQEQTSTSGTPTLIGWAEVTGNHPLPAPSGTQVTKAHWDASKPWRLVNFWSSTCAPCREEIPTLNALTQNKDLQILGVSRDQFLKYARSFEKELGARFPSWMDSDGEYAERLVGLVPRNALPISALTYKGNVVAVHVGPIENAEEVLSTMKSTVPNSR